MKISEKSLIFGIPLFVTSILALAYGFLTLFMVYDTDI